jgi:predicted nucleotidyltransferase
MASTAISIIDLVKIYIQRLTDNNIPVQKALLFGSHVNGVPRDDSDIDLAIISTAFKGDRFSDRRMIVPFRRGLDSRIEPMPFTPDDFAEGGVLIDEIKKTGRAISVVAEV